MKIPHMGSSSILYDVTHTSHCEVNSGIQRVVRRLAREWSEDEAAQSVVYDRYARAWRFLDRRESSLLRFEQERRPGMKRGAAWSMWQRIRGRWSRRGLPFVRKPDGHYDAFLCPELFSGDHRGDIFKTLRSQMNVEGPMAAIFYDMIPLQMPEMMPQKVVASFKAYLEDLRGFDIIAAISDDSRDKLIKYWRDNNITTFPRVVSVPLGVDAVTEAVPVARTRGNNVPLVLSVGTLEARKNHLSLLSACEDLWSKGMLFRLRLIGILNRETGAAVARRIEELREAGRPIEWWPHSSDQALLKSYMECDFTVYPSLYEGFGLPVLESLAHGRPCICSGQSAMAEIVRAGEGCLAIGEPTVANLSLGIRALLDDRENLVRLSHAALSYPIRTWDNYASSLRSLLLDIPESPSCS